MSEFEPPAPGWWKASDDEWYPPESHPDYTPAGPPPVPQPAPPQQLPPAPHAAPQAAPPLPSDLALASTGSQEPTKPWWKKWWAIAGAAVVALFVIVGIAGGGGSDDTTDVVDTVVADATQDDDPVDTQDDERSEPEQDPQGDPDETGDTELSLGGPSELGTRDDPLAYDALVPVVFSALGDADGSVWNVEISPPTDITDLVLSENSFNDPPPEGVVFAGFDVQMTLASAGKEPLSPGFNFTWEILGGSTSAVYESSTIDGVFGCGVTPNEFDRFAEVFVAGTLTGTVCIPLPAADLDAPGTFVSMNFRGDRLVFATDGARPTPANVADSSESPRGTNLAYDAEVPVTFSSFGDADRSVWNVTVSSPRDVGTAILDANQFNDPPPEGVTFVGFDVAMTLAAAGKEPLSPGFNFTWEILGGATAAVYEAGTIDGLFGCGSSSNDFDDFAEVFVGGTLSGLVCIPIPTQDVDHPDTQVAMNFSGDRIAFTVDGPTPTPADLEVGDGVAGVGSALPLDVPVDLDWDTIGDADRSTWTTTLSNWRDITAEVAEENSFNDPPPDGVIFVGFDAEMTLVDAEKEPLSVGFNFSWEVLGADTNRVYSEATISDLFGCGVAPNEFDDFAEVFAGGTLRGTVCIPLPASDFADPGTRIALNFSGERITFSPTD